MNLHIKQLMTLDFFLVSLHAEQKKNIDVSSKNVENRGHQFTHQSKNKWKYACLH